MGYEDLRNIFEHKINAIHIAEELQSVQFDADSVQLKKIMESKDFDIYDINDGNLINGYIEIAALKGGNCNKYFQSFTSSDLIADSTPLKDILPLLKYKSRIFVLYGTEVKGISIISNLQKLTVRLFLFDLISFLEIKITNLILLIYPDDNWEPLIFNNNFNFAKKRLQKLEDKNEHLELVDSLVFSDKIKILSQSKCITDH